VEKSLKCNGVDSRIRGTLPHKQTFIIKQYNNKINLNNNQICIAQVCQMTSEVLDGQLQSCNTARARSKYQYKCKAVK